MLLCRTGRLSAAALDQAFKSPGSFLVQVKANRLRDVALTLRKDRTFQGHRCFCVDSTGAHLRKQRPDPQSVKTRESPCGFVSADWAQLHRVSAVAANLSRLVQSEGGSDIIVCANRRHISRAELPGNVVFTESHRGVSSRRCAAGTMQTRGLSTKSRGEQTADSNKGEEQILKEASSAASAPPGEPEPVGEKPNRNQQLKKVFKEYGAVGVSFHIGISLMSLGMFYLLISSGIDIAAVLCKLGFSEVVVRSKMAAGTSTFVLAYAIHKLFAPVRISITLVSVPLIVRYFRKTGLFKPPTPAP